jgi:hypothetical protein
MDDPKLQAWKRLDAARKAYEYACMTNVADRTDDERYAIDFQFQAAANEFYAAQVAWDALTMQSLNPLAAINCS